MHSQPDGYSAAEWVVRNLTHTQPQLDPPGPVRPTLAPSQDKTNADAKNGSNIRACVPIDMWYRESMKRYGACSLREGGPCFGRPTPLQFGSTGAEGRAVEPTQVVDFQESFRYFWHAFNRKPGKSTATRSFEEPKDGARSGDKRRSLRGFLGRKRASPSTMELLARFIDYGTAVHCWEHGTKYAGT
jgi:hypothetical protein